MTKFIVKTENEARLLKLMMGIYGPLVTKDNLWRILGYTSSTALRMAVSRNTSPVLVFGLPHRHNKFALCMEIAKWLLEQRLKNCESALQFIDEVPKGLLRNYGVVLHEKDIMMLLKLENRDELRDRSVMGTLPFPVFTIDHRQTKLFALTCEVPLHIEDC
jgi:hypothetical protein